MLRRRRRGLLVELDGAIEFAEQLVHIAQVQQRPDSPDASMASLLAASASRLSSSARTHFAAGGVISAEMRQRPALTAAVLELTLNRQRARVVAERLRTVAERFVIAPDRQERDRFFLTIVPLLGQRERLFLTRLIAPSCQPVTWPIDTRVTPSSIVAPSRVSGNARSKKVRARSGCPAWL